MAKISIDALALPPCTPVVMRPLEFSRFPTAGADPAAANPVAPTLGSRPAHVAAA
jgi:hypothetical protein